MVGKEESTAGGVCNQSNMDRNFGDKEERANGKDKKAEMAENI